MTLPSLPSPSAQKSLTQATTPLSTHNHQRWRKRQHPLNGSLERRDAKSSLIITSGTKEKVSSSIMIPSRRDRAYTSPSLLSGHCGAAAQQMNRLPNLCKLRWLLDQSERGLTLVSQQKRCGQVRGARRSSSRY